MINVGDLIKNEYSVLKLIGDGGASKVWLSQRTEGGELFAIKEIAKDNPIYRATVNPDGSLTEVDIVKDLNHIFIPKVSAVYEDDEAILIIMEYVDGLDLDTVLESLDEHRLSEEDAVFFGMELCEIFAYLHTRENPIIYKDLKPANIMINKEGDVKLIDFGIAQYMKGNQNRKIVKIGTNGYASPEHLKDDIDERADIFTLGRTLYALTAGRLPGYVKRYRNKSGEIKEKRVYEPKPFKELGINNISPEFENIVFKCMREDRNLRYQSAAEVLTALMDITEKKKKKKTRKKQERKDESRQIRKWIASALVITFIFFIAFYILVSMTSAGLPKL